MIDTKRIVGSEEVWDREILEAMKGLLHNCVKLQIQMGGYPSEWQSKTSCHVRWDSQHPTFFYLERSMEWGQRVLDKENAKLLAIYSSPLMA